ncbi:MAG: cytochrome P460 family protein [Bdellovibrionales bacterium]|nr:cytochrome P460 family protein [Bdellovibrionales bacterium]
MLLLIFLLSFNVFANEQVEHFPGGDIQMNGMTLADYAGFEKKWEMVTIRYREDSGEMRITYGNDIAVKAL